MNMPSLRKPEYVNRHTGGLETDGKELQGITHVNRHTGGLETTRANDAPTPTR